MAANSLRTVLRYQLEDAFRSRWLLQHTGIYLLVAEGLILAAGTADRAILSLVNVVLLLVPLGALVFGTIHLHAARDFIVLMITQPIRRTGLFFGIYLGLVIPEAGGLALGLTLPFLLHGLLVPSVLPEFMLMITLAIALTAIFTAIALLLATRSRDRLRCIALALTVWLVMAVAYDGLILLLVNSLARYPIEQPLMGLMALNPVDLARVVLLLQLDAAAMMGYTGAVFSRFFGSVPGMLVAVSALTVWIAAPLVATWRSFLKLDF